MRLLFAVLLSLICLPALADTKFSQFNSSTYTPATDFAVGWRSGTPNTNIYFPLGSSAVENLGTVIVDDGAGHLTLGSGVVTNAMLANSSTTVNGQTCTLGSTCSGNASITLSGDTTGSGTTAITTTTAKVNGVSYGTSPSSNTVPVVTGANTVTYEAVPNAALANSSITIAGHSVSLGGSQNLTASDVGLGSVTNDTQTKAAIVPNTAPSAGQILVGNAGGTAYAPQTVSGSGATISMASTGAVTISAIANASLATQTANTVLGALTATTPSGLALPSCTDTGGNHLNYTSGTGFSCGTTSSKAGTVTSIATTSPITGGTITTSGTIACATCATTTNGGALSGTAPIAVSAAGVISGGGLGTVTGALRGNGSGTITQAACADLSNGAASCSTDTTNASNITAGTLPDAQDSNEVKFILTASMMGNFGGL